MVLMVIHRITDEKNQRKVLESVLQYWRSSLGPKELILTTDNDRILSFQSEMRLLTASVVSSAIKTTLTILF